MDIQSRIKALREENRLSQYDMAEKLNISQSAYLQIEKGKTELTVSRLKQIAEVLEVTVADLLGSERQEPEGGAESKKVEKVEHEIQYLKALLESRDAQLQAYRVISQAFIDTLRDVEFSHYGKVIYHNLRTGEVVELSAQETLGFPRMQELENGVKLGLVKKQRVLSDKEKERAYSSMINFDFNTFRILFQLDMIHDKELIEYWESYERKAQEFQSTNDEANGIQ
jgi:XRE family transcriptional regulator, regulator of sulfur utilization